MKRCGVHLCRGLMMTHIKSNNDILKRVAVVILNWNGKHFLNTFLQGIIDHSGEIADIYVADNASTDNSVEFVQEHFPIVKIIVLDKNWGFAGGYNRALANIDAEYFILLNSDVEVPELWIEPVIKFMDENPDYAACQPKLLSYYHRDCFEYAGAAGGYLDKLGYPFCRGRIFQSIEQDDGQYDDYAEIFWATGACMFVKANNFREIGGFDDGFFAHMEEIDLCWRLKNAGYKIGYCPDSKVYHIGGGTLPSHSSRKTYLNMRNNITMLYKNLPSSRLYYVMMVRFLLDFVASWKFFIDGGFNDFWAVICAHASFFRRYRKNRHKRLHIPHLQVSCMYKKSIVFRHYVHGINKFSALKQKHFSK